MYCPTRLVISSGLRTSSCRTMVNMSTSSSCCSCCIALYTAQSTPQPVTPSLKTKWSRVTKQWYTLKFQRDSSNLDWLLFLEEALVQMILPKITIHDSMSSLIVQYVFSNSFAIPLLLSRVICFLSDVFVHGYW